MLGRSIRHSVLRLVDGPEKLNGLGQRRLGQVAGHEQKRRKIGWDLAALRATDTSLFLIHRSECVPEPVVVGPILPAAVPLAVVHGHRVQVLQGVFAAGRHAEVGKVREKETQHGVQHEAQVLRRTLAGARGQALLEALDLVLALLHRGRNVVGANALKHPGSTHKHALEMCDKALVALMRVPAIAFLAYYGLELGDFLNCWANVFVEGAHVRVQLPRGLHGRLEAVVQKRGHLEQPAEERAYPSLARIPARRLSEQVLQLPGTRLVLGEAQRTSSIHIHTPRRRGGQERAQPPHKGLTRPGPFANRFQFGCHVLPRVC